MSEVTKNLIRQLAVGAKKLIGSDRINFFKAIAAIGLKVIINAKGKAYAKTFVDEVMKNNKENETNKELN